MKKNLRLPKTFAKVTNRSYGTALKGTKIYYEGRRPPKLRDDGSISFGKNILEVLAARFGKAKWIITKQTDSITMKGRTALVRTSARLLSRMGAQLWDRRRDLKVDIINRTFSTSFPDYFKTSTRVLYLPGTLANTLDKSILPKLTDEDRVALLGFLPAFVSSEAVGSVNLLKASAQIQSLRQLAAALEEGMRQGRSESWWQQFVKSNILLIQQGYIAAISKMNISIGNTKFPDFSLVTHDNYLDILEIKKPDTDLLKEDGSRGNYYWDAEISKAIIQIENYIWNVSSFESHVRNYIRDKYNIDLKVVRPRGILLAGSAAQLTSAKQRDDFRLLAQGLKSVLIVTYDELLARLENYIEVLEQFRKPSMKKPRDWSRRRKGKGWLEGA